MPTRLASIAAAAQTAIRLRHERIRRLHSQAAAPNTAAAAAACPDGNPNPSAAATAWASGGRERLSAALNTIVSPVTPAQVTASTSTGAHDRQAMPSSRPTASAMTAIPAGPPALLTGSITAVSGGARCAATNRATGWSSTAIPSPSVTSSTSLPTLAAASATAASPRMSDSTSAPSAGTRPGLRNRGPQRANRRGHLGSLRASWVAGQSRSRWWATPTRSTRPPQHHEAAGGEHEPGDDYGQLHRFTSPAGTSLPPIWDVGQAASPHPVPPGAPGKSCMAAYGLLD